MARSRPPTTEGVGESAPVCPSAVTDRVAPSSPPGPAITRASATGVPAAMCAIPASSPASAPGTTGWTKTSRIPPQVSPTAKASSSLNPKRSSTGSPLSMAAWHSSYTAPSTHPPETLPTASPSVSTARAAPGSRGALPETPTTVATAKERPAACQACSCSAMSCMAVAPYTVSTVAGTPPYGKRSRTAAVLREGRAGPASARRART